MTGSASELLDRLRATSAPRIYIATAGRCWRVVAEKFYAGAKINLGGFAEGVDVAQDALTARPGCGSTTAVRHGMKTLTKSVTNLPVMRTLPGVT